MEDLRGLQLAAHLDGDGVNGGLEDLRQPRVGHQLDGVLAAAGDGPIGLQVVEHALALTLLDVQAGQSHHLTVVVAGVNDLGLNGDVVAVGVGVHGELGDVVAHLVELLDSAAQAPALIHGEGLLGGEHVPQLGVAADDPVPHLNGVHGRLQQGAGLEVHELADDVGAGHVDVVEALAVREPLGVELPGLGVHQVGGEGPGVAAEERVGQGHVPPVEAQQVQAHQQHGERVDESGGGLRPHVLAEQRPVGQGVGQVLSDEHRVELLTGDAGAAGDNRRRMHAGRPQAQQVAQELVLAVGHGLADLLDRDDALREVDETHDVAGQTTGQRGEDLGGPLLQRRLPGEVEQRRINGRRRDLHGLGHRVILSGQNPICFPRHEPPTTLLTVPAAELLRRAAWATCPRGERDDGAAPGKGNGAVVLSILRRADACRWRRRKCAPDRGGSARRRSHPAQGRCAEARAR